MYCKYYWNTSQTKAGLLSDISALLTGETNVANLSAGCDLQTTTFFGIDPAGWTMHDAAAGTNKVVVKSPTIDDPAQIKYLEIDTNNTGSFKIDIWHGWDEIAHTGTFSGTPPYGWDSTITFNVGTAGYVVISASAQRVIFANNLVPISSSRCVFVLECDRGFDWCDIGEGFTPFVIGNNYTNTGGSIGYCSSPRYKTHSFDIIEGATGRSMIYVPDATSGYLNTAWGYLTNAFPGTGTRPAVGVNVLTALFKDIIIASSSGQLGPWYSGISNTKLHFVSMNGVAMEDELTIGGDTYVLLPFLSFPQSSSNGFAVVPKG